MISRPENEALCSWWLIWVHILPNLSKNTYCTCAKIETDPGASCLPDRPPAIAGPTALFSLFLLRQSLINFFFQAVLNSEAQIGFGFEILLPRSLGLWAYTTKLRHH